MAMELSAPPACAQTHPEHFFCPWCGGDIIDTMDAGDEVDCPACGKSFTIAFLRDGSMKGGRLPHRSGRKISQLGGLGTAEGFNEDVGPRRSMVAKIENIDGNAKIAAQTRDYSGRQTFIVLDVGHHDRAPGWTLQNLGRVVSPGTFQTTVKLDPNAEAIGYSLGHELVERWQSHERKRHACRLQGITRMSLGRSELCYTKLRSGDMHRTDYRRRDPRRDVGVGRLEQVEIFLRRRFDTRKRLHAGLKAESNVSANGLRKLIRKTRKFRSLANDVVIKALSRPATVVLLDGKNPEFPHLDRPFHCEPQYF